MESFYFEKLKSSLKNPPTSKEELSALMEETRTFLGVLRIKFESGNPDLQEEAAQEIGELKDLLARA